MIQYNKISIRFVYFLYFLYFSLFGLVFFVHLFNTGHLMKYYILGYSLLTILMLLSSNIISQIADKIKTLYILLILCLIVKVAWIMLFQTQPASDYLTFYRTAQMLASNWVIDFNYVNLFPHIMGYSSFLSVFYFLFGDSLLIAPILNVLLSTISMYFIYYICERIYNKNAAAISSLIWIFFPSQLIYNSMVLSEPFYTTLILAFWTLLVHYNDRIHTFGLWKLVAISLTGGIILGIINAARPIASIIYISLVIWFLISLDKEKYLIDLKRKLVLVILVGVSLFCFNQLINIYNESRLGKEVASTVGYNIYVGFNEESRGKWNQEDSNLLFSYVENNPTWTANDVQLQMLQEAKDRIFGGDINFVSLFYDKIHLLWGDDSMAYKYSDINDHPTLFINISNLYYFFAILCSFIGLFALTRKSISFSVILVLYILGLTAAHLLSEVAYRYHYSGITVITILAGIGVYNLNFRYMKKGVRKKITPRNQFN